MCRVCTRVVGCGYFHARAQIYRVLLLFFPSFFCVTTLAFARQNNEADTQNLGSTLQRPSAIQAVLGSGATDHCGKCVCVCVCVCTNIQTFIRMRALRVQR